MSEYIITNGSDYLRCNRRGDYYLVDECSATTWRTYKQALNALNNGISKYERKLFYVEKLCKENNSGPDVDQLIEADTGDFDSWVSSIGNFKSLVNTLEIKRNALYSELSEIDQELCDIRHYIEFGRLNAYQGWAAYEMMKASLMKRRRIKDALYIITKIQNRGKGVTESESARVAIYNLNTRKYTPRKLDYLFESAAG